MSRLCIIPARGGSKRIPGKNIRDFLGKPILAYSITAALESELYDRVLVSTDSEVIAEIARATGAEVPFMRSAANADDYASTVDVLREVHDQLAESFTEACCLYPTAPLVTAEQLRQAHDLLSSTDADCVLPIVRFGYPIQRALRRDDAGYISLFEPANLAVRSQDLEPAYHDCGMFYVYHPERTLPYGKLLTDKVAAIELPETRVQDIDTLEDWRMAELKYQAYSNGWR